MTYDIPLYMGLITTVWSADGWKCAPIGCSVIFAASNGEMSISLSLISS